MDTFKQNHMFDGKKKTRSEPITLPWAEQISCEEATMSERNHGAGDHCEIPHTVIFFGRDVIGKNCRL